jgi:arylsulfatase A-like enzyme
LLGISVGLSLFLWAGETLLFLLSKLRRPDIWFHFPWKVGLFYLGIGCFLALLFQAVFFLISKIIRRASLKQPAFLIAVFLGFYVAFYGFSFFFLKPAILLPFSLRFFLFAVFTGPLVYLCHSFFSGSWKRILALMKILLAAAVPLVLLLAVFGLSLDINSRIFPRVPPFFERRAEEVPNLVVIVLDAVRADSIGCLGNREVSTPHIDRIAREGVLFTQGIAQSSWTLPSLGSIFTSSYPSQHGAVRKVIRKKGRFTAKFYLEDGQLFDENITMAEILRHNGFYTAAFQSNITAGSMENFHQGYLFHFDCFKFNQFVFEAASAALTRSALNRWIDPHFVYASDSSVVDYITHWVRENRRNRFFLFTLLFDSHEYYLLDKNKKNRFLNPSRKLYNAAISKADVQVGRIYSLLEETGLLDNTVLVVLSDHGEEFFDHGGTDRGYDSIYDRGSFHGHTLYDELIRIPLIIRCPRKLAAGGIIQEQVSGIDLLPTLLTLLGISHSGPFEGRDLFAKNAADAPAFSEAVFEGTEKKSIRTGDWKLIYHSEDQIYELYNLREDPGEKHNLADDPPDIFDELRKKLFDWMDRMPEETKSRVKRKLTPKEREALKSLGYIK